MLYKPDRRIVMNQDFCKLSGRWYHSQAGHINCSDITRTSWRLKLPATQLFFQQFIWANNKENMKNPHSICDCSIQTQDVYFEVDHVFTMGFISIYSVTYALQVSPDQLTWMQTSCHYDVTRGKHFPCYRPFVRGIHRSPVISPHKGQWRGALIFPLIWAWINRWVNNREAGDLRRDRAHYDITVMWNKAPVIQEAFPCYTVFTWTVFQMTLLQRLNANSINECPYLILLVTWSWY